MSKNTKVLLIEDSPETQKIVQSIFGSTDYQLTTLGTLKEAEAALRVKSYDLILLDLSLPDGDGMDLCSRLKNSRETENVPVFFLTGKDDITNKVTAFSLGAEDYIVKPFNPLELRARVEAKIRKNQKASESDSVLNKGALSIDQTAQQVLLADGTAIDFTSREFRILHFLARNEGRVYSRDQLLTAIWGENVHITDRTIDSHVYSIRKKLGALAGCVESVTGTGYRFNSRHAPLVKVS